MRIEQPTLIQQTTNNVGSNSIKWYEHKSLICFTIALFGMVFFYKSHNPFLSLNEFWTGWEEGDDKAAGGNVIKGLALSSLWFLGVYSLWIKPHGAKFSPNNLLAVLMIFYLFWCSLSVLWAEAPSMAIRQLAVLYFLVTCGIGLSRHLQIKDIAFIAFVVLGTFASLGFVMEIGLGTFRPWSSGYRFAGTVHPNAQGAYLTIFILATVCLLRSQVKHRNFVIGALVAGVGLLLLTKSRTSVGGLLVALSAMWLVQSSVRFKLFSLFASLWILLVAVLAMLFVGIDPTSDLTEVFLMGRGEESEALTGRLPIWIEMTSYIQERFWTGYGYQAFWNPNNIEVLSEELSWTFRESHSSYIDGLLTIGFLGTSALFFVAFLGLIKARNLFVQTNDPGYVFVVSLIAFGFVNAFMESGMIAASLDTLLLGTCLAKIAFWSEEPQSSNHLAASPNTPRLTTSYSVLPSTKLELDGGQR